MTYKETLSYLFSQLPMYQRIGAAAYKADLNNTIALCNHLKNPQHKFRSIHVAGTNGKGSTSHMLASVFQEAGYKVGLYTSPHLKDFRERIKINGKEISKNYVVDFVEKNKKIFKQIQPSFFEMTVGMAFQYFAEKKVDVAVIEVGLGGRLDSTNVITPDLSIITNISFDHSNLLGNTLQKIAAEKAGIIKPEIPVIIGETQKEVKQVFIDKAKKENSLLLFADVIYKTKNFKAIAKQNKPTAQFDLFSAGAKNKLIIKNMYCGLTGIYQQKNIQTVIAATFLLQEALGYTISVDNLKAGLENVVKNTGLLGRWQQLSQKPLIIADTGHNEAGIREILKQLKVTKYNKLHWVYGAVNDKDIDKILQLLPKKATYYFCKASIPRSLNDTELRVKANKIGLNGKNYGEVKNALKIASKAASVKDLVLVCGSTFIVADIL